MPKFKTKWGVVDRSGWPYGTWDNEPDQAEWIDKVTGYQCLAIRHGVYGHWCGYVGLPKTHPLLGREYTDIRGAGVHGNVTYAGHITEGDGTWWVGFDCGHFMHDFSPGQSLIHGILPSGMRMVTEAQYKDWAFVKGELRSLAYYLKRKADVDKELNP